MKTILKFLFVAILGTAVFASCGAKQENKEEEKAEQTEQKTEKEMDEDLQRKIAESRAAYKLATEMDSTINAKYKVTDLVVAAGGGLISVTGEVGSEDDKKAIEKMLLEDKRIKEVSNGLTVKKP